MARQKQQANDLNHVNTDGSDHEDKVLDSSQENLHAQEPPSQSRLDHIQKLK